MPLSCHFSQGHRYHYRPTGAGWGLGAPWADLCSLSSAQPASKLGDLKGAGAALRPFPFCVSSGPPEPVRRLEYLYLAAAATSIRGRVLSCPLLTEPFGLACSLLD